MTDIVVTLLAQVADREARAGRIHDADDCELYDELGFACSCTEPARVRAQCAAIRAVLDIHRRPLPGEYPDLFPDCCRGCGFGGPCDDPAVEDINQCPTLLALVQPRPEAGG